MQIKVGDKFPDFKLNDENSNEFSLYKNNSKNYLVLYFYPKDETPVVLNKLAILKIFTRNLRY